MTKSLGSGEESLEQTGMLAFADEEDGPKSFAEQRTRNRPEAYE